MLEIISSIYKYTGLTDSQPKLHPIKYLVDGIRLGRNNNISFSKLIGGDVASLIASRSKLCSRWAAILLGLVHAHVLFKTILIEQPFFP